MARYNLLLSRHILAFKITKWTRRRDQRLLWSVSYIHQNNDISMFRWVGDRSADWRLWLYTGADFAAETSTQKSVSGVFSAIRGPTSYFPLCVYSKKQRAVSHSTAESERVAADMGLRTEVLPLMTLFDAVLNG